MSVVSEEEIKHALGSIKRDKAPGPDGYNSAFYLDNWSIVGPDFVQAISHFFSTGYMTRQWNATTPTLIPKTKPLLP